MDLTDPQLQELAQLLHAERCHASHTDQCGWYYEADTAHPWIGASHQIWLKRATAFAGESPKGLLKSWTQKARTVKGLRTELRLVERLIKEEAASSV